MNKTGRNSGTLLLFLSLLLVLLITPASAGNFTPVFNASDVVHVNQTYTLDNSGTTPFIVWLAAIALGVILVVLSFLKYPNGEEGLLSVMAWIPVAYAMYTSFKVDSVTGYGVTGIVNNNTSTFALIESHTVYHFDVVGVLLFILLIFAIGNTYRIWANSRKLKELSSSDPEDLM